MFSSTSSSSTTLPLASSDPPWQSLSPIGSPLPFFASLLTSPLLTSLTGRGAVCSSRPYWTSRVALLSLSSRFPGCLWWGRNGTLPSPCNTPHGLIVPCRAAFEIVALAAGRLGALPLAAQSIIMTADQSKYSAVAYEQRLTYVYSPEYDTVRHR